MTVPVPVRLPTLERSRAAEDAQGASCPLTSQELVLLVYRQMRTLAGPGRDLDDLVQTALEQLLRARFEGRSAFSTFSHGVCYRVWLKHLRFRHRFRLRFLEVGAPPDIADEDPAVDATLEEKERAQRLYAALDRITPKRRAVLTLFEIAGLPTKEIARIVDASEPTVRTRLRDARLQLEALLKADEYFLGAGSGQNALAGAAEVSHGCE